MEEAAGFTDLSYARVDTDRARRQGLPEVVYGPGKHPAQIAGIVSELLRVNAGPVMVTRVEREDAEAALKKATLEHPDIRGQYDAEARLLSWRSAHGPSTGHSSDPGEDLPAGSSSRASRPWRIAVVSAGTSDQAVAAEAAAVSATIGLEVLRIQDVGVAGLHRLIAALPEIETADVVVAVAGMEGALASVLGGLVSVPIIAVPTSTGYGAALEGVTALLAMATSCAAGLTVVNIDGGFSAAMAAHRLMRAAERREAHP